MPNSLGSSTPPSLVDLSIGRREKLKAGRGECKLGVCTMSLGHVGAGHFLPDKLEAARRHGVEGVEVFDDDLFHIADSVRITDGGRNSPKNLEAAARRIGALCDAHGLEIICLQPFRHLEGHRDRKAHASRLKEFGVWVKLARLMGTDMILIPSTFLEAKELIANDDDILVADLLEAASLAAVAGVRISYEALSWGTLISTWERAWEMVSRVNRPNFGLCIDTFNLAARVYADLSSASGRRPDGEGAMIDSLRRLLNSVSVDKLFLLQVGDGARLSSPLVPGHELYDPSQPCLMSWSRKHRLFYGEQTVVGGGGEGGYLPIREVLEVVLQGLGYKGWVSFEVFNHRLSDPSKGVPEEMARRAAFSWGKIVDDSIRPQPGQASARL